MLPYLCFYHVFVFPAIISHSSREGEECDISLLFIHRYDLYVKRKKP